MLGDTGSNLVGALIGIWLVTTLSDPGRLVALAVLVALDGLWGVSVDLLRRSSGFRCSSN